MEGLKRSGRNLDSCKNIANTPRRQHSQKKPAHNAFLDKKAPRRWGTGTLMIYEAMSVWVSSHVCVCVWVLLGK